MSDLTFKDWMKKQFSYDELSDLSQYGAQGGFSGLIYYFETCALYETYREEIWDMLERDREDFGMKTCAELIASFNGAKDVASDEQYKNLLVWYAAERIAYELTEGRDWSDEEESEIEQLADAVSC